MERIGVCVWEEGGGLLKIHNHEARREEGVPGASEVAAMIYVPKWEVGAAVWRCKYYGIYLHKPGKKAIWLAEGAWRRW